MGHVHEHTLIEISSRSDLRAGDFARRSRLLVTMQQMTRTTETTSPPETLDATGGTDERRAREGDAPSAAEPAPEKAGAVRMGRFSSLRARVLFWFVGLLAVATIASVLVARAVLLGQLDERIDAELVQESEELRNLATGNDPETGEPFRGSVRRIFEVFIERNIPLQNEALLTFVGGEPFLTSGDDVPYRLDQDPELVAHWGGLERTERRRIDTPAGDVDYLAMPLQDDGETRGVFVVAIFRDPEEDKFQPAIVAVGVVGLVILLVGSLLAWRLAEGILRPVRMVTGTTREISETDLHRRIPVEGTDEIAQLTSTFNEMLDRLQTAFDTQRRFVDDAGHELRTPITIVRGHLELLEDDAEERRKTLDVVLDELDRMGRIVNDLLCWPSPRSPDFSPASRSTSRR
jgi:two-component system, OmpR family, sensor kinase